MGKKARRKPRPAKGTPNENKVEVFCRYIVRNGKKIYPVKSKYFHFWVMPKTSQS